MKARVAIVEDHSLLADTLSLALRASYDVTAFVPTELGAIVPSVTGFEPDVVLLDLELGDIGESLPLIKPLRQTGAAVVMMTGVTDEIRLAECLEAGALGIINKSVDVEELLEAIAELTDLGTLLSQHQRDALMAELQQQRAEMARLRAPFQRLTPREQEILQWMADGLSPDEMSQKAGMAIATTRTHIRSVLRKLDVHSQVEAVAQGRRAGWL